MPLNATNRLPAKFRLGAQKRGHVALSAGSNAANTTRSSRSRSRWRLERDEDGNAISDNEDDDEEEMEIDEDLEGEIDHRKRLRSTELDPEDGDPFTFNVSWPI